MPKRLTPKQQRFCDEWLKDHNGTRSYLAVYRNVKKREAAWACASRLLSSASVRAYIRKRQAEMAKKYQIDREQVLKQEACIAFSNIASLFKDGKILPPDELPEKTQRAIASFEVKELPGGIKVFKYRFWSKGRALERISKHLGLYERHNQQKRPSLQEVFDALAESSPDLAEAVRASLAKKLKNNEVNSDAI